MLRLLFRRFARSFHQLTKPLVLEAVKKRKLGHDCVNLEDVRPLELDKNSSTSAPSTFKEAWQPENAEASIRTRGICEAGCSLFWVTPLAQKDWDSEVTWAAVVRGTSLLKPKSLEGSVRILWPFTLQCVTADVLPADNYPKALEMVHGNVLLYSWWVDIYRAFHGSDYERVSMLLECALCVTVNLQLLPRRRSGLIARYIWAASDTREMSDVLAIPCHVFAFKGRIPNRRAAGRYKVVPEEDLGGSPGRLQGGAAEVSGQGLEQA